MVKKNSSEEVQKKTKTAKATIQTATASISKEQLPSKISEKINRKQRLMKIKSRISTLVKLDEKQINKAVKCLKQINLQAKSADVLNIGDDFIYLEIVVNKVPMKYSIRPVQIPLATPIYSKEMNSKFCIFSQNPQRKFKDFISELDIPLIQRVIGYAKIPKKYPTYNDKRKLMYEYDVFFCDKNIYRLLDKSLGKAFYERKKIPFPIDCEGVPESQNFEKYDDYLNSLGNSSYFVQGTGPVQQFIPPHIFNSTLKIARISFDEKDVVKNVIQGVHSLLPEILSENGMSLSCLRMVNLKLASSVSLPIFVRMSERESEVYQRLNQ